METNKIQTSKLFVYMAVDFKDEFEEVCIRRQNHTFFSCGMANFVD